MATLSHLEIGVINLRERLTKELQFSHSAQAQITAAFNTLSEAVDHAEATVNNAFAERNRALELALGVTPQQQDEKQDEQRTDGEADQGNVVPAKRKVG